MKAIGLDTETTDLIKSKFRPLKSQPFIIEFFGIGLSGIPVSTIGQTKAETIWTEVDSLGELIKPPLPLTDEIVKITHITDEMLVGKPTFGAVAAKIAAYIETADLVFAHNLSFDKTMIDIEMLRAGIKINWPRQVCTVEATEHLLGRRLKLIELHQYLFNEPFADAHRAENDVRAMARCFIELSKRGIV